MTDLRYPIGEYQSPSALTDADLRTWIQQIESLPSALRAAVEVRTSEQLEVPYRPGGWDARQVIHHVADSHTQSYMRFKWALTEDLHVVTDYNEQLFVAIGDWQRTPIDVNLEYIAALHAKLVILLESLDRRQFSRRLVHPDIGELSIGEYVSRVAWHGRHHLAHIRLLAERDVPTLDKAEDTADSKDPYRAQNLLHPDEPSNQGHHPGRR